MKKETILILTIGNRDVQFKGKLDDLPKKHYDLLEPNNEGSESSYVIKKGKDAPMDFVEASKVIYDNYNDFEDLMILPMLKASLEKLGKKPQKIILTTSRQNPVHRQDCLYFAQIIQKNLNNAGFACEIDYCKHNPNNFELMVTYYNDLFEKYERDGAIVISNSGGTPNMRSSSHFAALFKGYEFITLSSSDGSNISNFQKQEYTVLAKIVKRMLHMYDYEGVKQLPHNCKAINELAEYAMARIALDKKSVLEKQKLDSLKQYEYSKGKDYKFLEREIILSALIKFHQGSYGDYLWRLFTFKENARIPLVEEILGGEIIYDNKNKHESWNDLLSKDPELLKYLKDAKFGSSPLKYDEPNAAAYEKIVHFYVKYQKTFKKPSLLNKLLTYIQELSNVRNNIAHRYEGTNKQVLNDVLKKQKVSIDDVNAELRNYVKLPADGFDVYDDINRRILDHLHA